MWAQGKVHALSIALDEGALKVLIGRSVRVGEILWPRYHLGDSLCLVHELKLVQGILLYEQDSLKCSVLPKV